MAERNGRSTCSSELQLRSDILSAISDGWAHVKSFEIPKPAPNVVSGNDQNDYKDKNGAAANTTLLKSKTGVKPNPIVEPIQTVAVEAMPGNGPC